MNSFSEFIKNNFKGATITITFVYGGTLTGEVVGGFDDILGLKVGGTIYFINTSTIVNFF